MKKTLNVAMIGGGFMGKAHSNAWLKVNTFFDAPFKVNLKVIVGSHTKLEQFAENWGYDEVSYDWREVVARPDIDIVVAAAAFVAVASSTVAVPILGYALSGKRLDPSLTLLRERMERHSAALVAVILIVIGAMLLYKGLHGR